MTKKKFLLLIPPVIIIFLAIFYVFFFKRVDIKKIDPDCEYLKKIFTEASVDISQTIDEGLDVNELIDEIKKEYSKEVKKQKFWMSINESGIADNRFANSLTTVLGKRLTRPNGHLYLSSPYGSYFPFTSYVLFASDILFEKAGSEYKVYSSGDEQIKPGMLYTGNQENLFKTIIDGKVLYRFGYFKNEWITTEKINIEGKDYKVKVNFTAKPIEEVQNFSFRTEGNILFVNTNTFMWHTEAEKNKIYDGITELGNTINDRHIELIVFDLRGNSGGYSDIAFYLLATLVTASTDDTTEEFDEYVRYYNYLHSNDICINTLTTRNRLSLEGRGDDNLTRYLLRKTDEKYSLIYDPEYEYLETITPAYKGKIIFISDIDTGSGAEDFILSTKTVFKDNVTIIGHNSRGAFDYANVYQFNLPDSRISIQLSFTDSTNTPLLKDSTCWQGDTKGVRPDYWFTFNGDFELSQIIDVLK